MKSMGGEKEYQMLLETHFPYQPKTKPSILFDERTYNGLLENQRKAVEACICHRAKQTIS